MSLLRILTLAALVALPTVTAEARDLGVSEEALRSACTGDYLRLCAGIDPNGDHVEACFRAKMARVSEGCRGAIAGYRVQETTNERRSQSR
ncbi:MULTISPECIES: hypothetical protein [unclassified Methylobacterium]|uniref:hypothetical protein n=1 Tax=unclassified Methylobacterium TaxID=2615210 RepID=UPI0011C1E0F7|nr:MULTISPECIES: hypothetical protein [unclassified Methylobacterium]QEE41029.1 hypothetical protein FVA80_20680 [Methylobacterium sp. WL1]TXN58876.1 hypothetical protein FV241_04675 [Methylobacterium sp. WL2]